MAQSALTVTPAGPTPPTNYPCTGSRPPNPPNFQRQNYSNPVSNPPPYFDDGIQVGATESVRPHSLNEADSPGNRLVFAAVTSALAGGTSAADNNTGTTAGTVVTAAGGTGFNSVAGTFPGVANGLVPASTSVAAEGAGTELAVTAPGSRAECPTIAVSCGPTLAAPAVGAGPVAPNQLHASSLSPAVNPALTSVSAGGASGTGTATVTATGTGFLPTSVIWVNGLPYATTYVSATSLTAVAPKKATAGNLPVVVITGGAVTTASQNWVFT